ncbi:MAG: ATP phosphoribosyltransferase [Pirellulales bacterium]
MTFVLALPSKGSLYDGTLALFARCGMTVQRDGRGRGYWGKLKHVDQVKVQFLRAEEIPLRVDAGDVTLGLTGFDLYQELCHGSEHSHVLVRSLGFGHARLVVAVPKVWIDVQDMNDLREVASEIRRKSGRGLRVGTKFPRAVRRFFADHSIRDYAIVDSLGATEGMPASGAADAIVDLTSSGSTLIENDLKELADGTVIASEASLLATCIPGVWTPENLATMTQIVECLEAGLRAEKRSLINFTILSDRLPRLHVELTKQCGCEVGWDDSSSEPAEELASGPLRSSVVCPAASVYTAYRVLRAAGATSICVVAPHLMFADASGTVAGFESLLKRRQDEDDTVDRD